MAGSSSKLWNMGVIVGCVPGPMGEISKIAILIGAIYLVARRAADWKIMLSVLVPSFISL